MLGYLIDAIADSSPMLTIVCVSAALVIAGVTALFVVMEGHS